MTETTFTFRVDEALKSQFAKVAKSQDRNSAQLIRDFMREYVQKQQEAAEHEAWFRHQVQVGLDSANSGNLVPATEVEAEAARWRAAATQRQYSSSE
jgi:predicted transcriptional regulator